MQWALVRLDRKGIKENHAAHHGLSVTSHFYSFSQLSQNWVPDKNRTESCHAWEQDAMGERKGRGVRVTTASTSATAATTW